MKTKTATGKPGVTNATHSKPAHQSGVVKYTVKTKGYSETFGDRNSAKAQYEVLKKRSVKSQESIKLELFSIDGNGHRENIESINIGEGFFKS